MPRGKKSTTSVSEVKSSSKKAGIGTTGSVCPTGPATADVVRDKPIPANRVSNPERVEATPTV